MKSKSRYDFDVAILGGGSAGYAAGRTAADAGLRVAVLEGGSQVGGLCILRGCMPSKALLYAAEVLHLARQGRTWGLKPGRIGFDFRKVMQRKAHLIGDFADYRRQQLERGNFQFIRAQARFVDAHTLELTELLGSPPGLRPSSKTLKARHFIIATGSVVSPPPIGSLDRAGYLTSDEVLSLTRLPKSVVLLGGGAIACELAQLLARFDVRVTIIQRSPHVLKEFDEDAASVVEQVLRQEGIRLFTGTKLLAAGRHRRRKWVQFEQKGSQLRVEADEILYALGRSPNTAGLDLDRAGVALEGSRILTNSFMRTSAPHIYAAGDCTGPHEIVHIAIQQAEVAAHNLAHPRRLRRMNYRLLINVVFTDPQVATVGLTEKAALAGNQAYLAASYPFNDHGKSLIMEAKDGFVKLLAHPKTGEILGGSCVGPAGGELIHEIVAAMARRMTVRELAALPHYHPTLAEIWTYPAEELAAKIPAAR